MSQSDLQVVTYKIANGQQNGPTLKGNEFHGSLTGVGIIAPAVLAETTVIQVNEKIDGTGAWTTLQDETPADIPGPIAGKARFYYQLANFPAFRLRASGVVAADRIFTLCGQETTE